MKQFSRSRISKVLLTLALVFVMLTSWQAFADDASDNYRTISGRAATFSTNGPNLHYDCIIDVVIDEDGRIVEVKDKGTLDFINESIANSDPVMAGILKENLLHWDTFIEGEGFAKFIGLTLDQIDVDNHEVDTVSGATSTSWTMKKAIVNAFANMMVEEDDVDTRDTDGDDEVVADESSAEAVAETTDASESQQENGKAEATSVEKVFVDTQNHWAKASISYLANKGIVNGVSATNFAPDSNIKRAELVQALANMANANLGTYGDAGFVDVDSNAWYAKAVAWAAQNGIAASGVSDKMFAPEAYVTRQDMAVMLDNYLAKVARVELASKVEKINFLDASKIATYAQMAVEKLQRTGIISGIASDANSYNFEPQALATRAQIAKVLADYLQAAE